MARGNHDAVEIFRSWSIVAFIDSMPLEIDAAIRVMAGQDGLAKVHQLIERGMSRGIIRSRVANGEWERPWRGVVGHAGMPWTWRRRCRLAVLCAPDGAALGHATAARIHGLDGYDRDDRVIVSHPPPTRPHPMPMGIVGTRTDLLQSRHCLVVDGLRCVIRPVALIQIAAMDGDDMTAKALDSMLRGGDRPAWIRHVTSSWRHRGVVGPATVMRLLDERVDARLPRSWFQRLVKASLAGYGCTTVDEYSVRDPSGRVLAELDLAIPALKIGVECQSWRWHATPAAKAHDSARKRSIRRLGWEIVEVWWSDLERMDDVADELRVLIGRQMPESTRSWPP